ncbi:MAG TPA: ABC transporter substrate-binding protein [Xanthobacteraceae bacterium]|nr:ABC transporter substrate-binding protein [Xanthobacteraceae bacterium]
MGSDRKLGTAQVLLAAIGLVSSALLTPALAEDGVKIGFATAMSGIFQPYDAEGVGMAEVFINDINAKGGILGKKVTSIKVDTKSDRVQGAQAGAEVVAGGAKLVVVTCDYDFGSPAAVQAQKAGLVSVSLCAGDPKMGPVGVGPYAFSAGIAAPAEGVTHAQWAYKKRNFRNAYILVDDLIQYDKSVCSGFEWGFTQLGGKIVGKDTFKNFDPNIAAQVTRLAEANRANKIDAIMLCTFLPGGASAIKQIRAAGIDAPIMSGQAMGGTFWLGSVPDLSNFYADVVGSVVDDPRKSINELLAKYQKLHGKPLTQVGSFSIYAWLELWTRAIQKAGTFDADKVVAIMNTYKDEPTSVQPYTFTPKVHIQAKTSLIITAITKGKASVADEITLPEAVPDDVLFRN